MVQYDKGWPADLAVQGSRLIGGGNLSNYSRTSVARTLMARLPRLF